MLPEDYSRRPKGMAEAKLDIKRVITRMVSGKIIPMEQMKRAFKIRDQIDRRIKEGQKQG
ncbi:MAG: hypothetical protein AB7I96_12995 [Candidatus Dadabacteria bacterium]